MNKFQIYWEVNLKKKWVSGKAGKRNCENNHSRENTEMTFLTLGSFVNEGKVSLKGSKSELLWTGFASLGVGLYLLLHEPLYEL